MKWGKRTGNTSEGRPVDDVSWGDEKAECGKNQDRGELEDGDEEDFFSEEFTKLACVKGL